MVSTYTYGVQQNKILVQHTATIIKPHLTHYRQHDMDTERTTLWLIA